MNPVSWILRSIWRILTFNISAIGLTSEKKEDKNSTNGKSVKIYNLDHAILNINIPPTSMWMNMGYWKDENITFPEACRALLDQVLLAAGIVSSLDEVDEDDGGDGHSQKCKTSTTTGTDCSDGDEIERTIHLLDVGIGCGDQSLYLLQKKKQRKAQEDGQRAPLFDSYVGLTLAPAQADYARRRVSELNSSSNREKESPTTSVKIFCADAANPSSWSEDVKCAVATTATTPRRTWLLALDTLYHFQPSRKPLLHYAHSNLDASLMAFDLLFSDSASTLDRLLLRLVCLFTGTPFSNFLTRKQYVDMLVNEVGYERERIEVKDISEWVFPGIARYMQRRERELSRYGMGLGKFKGAGKVFGWWGRSGIVRGVVVVAKARNEKEVKMEE